MEPEQMLELLRALPPEALSQLRNEVEGSPTSGPNLLQQTPVGLQGNQPMTGGIPQRAPGLYDKAIRPMELRKPLYA